MDKKSKKFLEEYLNNASPTGFESSGQQIWLDYINPYINTYISDTYGSMVGVINPDAKYKVVIEAHKKHPDKPIICTYMGGKFTKNASKLLGKNGIPDYNDLKKTSLAMKALMGKR